MHYASQRLFLNKTSVDIYFCLYTDARAHTHLLYWSIDKDEPAALHLPIPHLFCAHPNLGMDLVTHWLVFAGEHVHTRWIYESAVRYMGIAHLDCWLTDGSYLRGRCRIYMSTGLLTQMWNQIWSQDTISLMISFTSSITVWKHISGTAKFTIVCDIYMKTSSKVKNNPCLGTFKLVQFIIIKPSVATV